MFNIAQSGRSDNDDEKLSIDVWNEVTAGEVSLGLDPDPMDEKPRRGVGNVPAERPKWWLRGKFLTRQEETDLVARARAGDSAARECLIAAHLPLVASLAKKYRSLEFDEAIGIGSLGLLKAFDKFDETRGNRFSTCARWWIRDALKAHMEGLIKSSTSTLRNGRAPRKKPGGPTDLDRYHSVNGATEWWNLKGVSRRNDLDIARETSGVDGDDEPAAMVFLPRVMRALEKLNPQERHLIRRYFLSEKPTPLEKLACEVGVPPNKIRRIKDRALENLRGLVLFAEQSATSAAQLEAAE